jgi:hypothetical protein
MTLPEVNLVFVGWEPDKDRNTSSYLRPFEDTFSLDPLGCLNRDRPRVDLVILQHSAARNVDVRTASRSTWKNFDQR